MKNRMRTGALLIVCMLVLAACGRAEEKPQAAPEAAAESQSIEESVETNSETAESEAPAEKTESAESTEPEESGEPAEITEEAEAVPEAEESGEDIPETEEDPESGEDAPAGPALSAEWGDKIQLLEGYDEVTVQTGEPQSAILLSAGREVKELIIYSVTITDVREDGTLVFDRDELYRKDSLTPDRPLLVHLTFAGDLPGHMITYVDADGSEKECMLGISGRDGSLFLEELE